MTPQDGALCIKFIIIYYVHILSYAFAILLRKTVIILKECVRTQCALEQGFQ